MISWIGARAIFKEKLNRIVVAVSGVIPDIDGLGLLIDFSVKPFGYTPDLWGIWHHYLHSLPFGILVSGIAAGIVKAQKSLTALVCFLIFHLHLLCDLIGSRGPDGYQWPIPYFSPVSQELQLTWSGQWELNAWPNILLTFTALTIIVVLIRVTSTSPFELLGKKMDRILVNMINRKEGK